MKLGLRDRVQAVVFAYESWSAGELSRRLVRVARDQRGAELSLAANDRLAVSLQLMPVGAGGAELLPLAHERLERALKCLDGFALNLHGVHASLRRRNANSCRTET
jgi:hypothetical protein